FVRRRTDRDRLWVAERGEGIVGSIAIVGTSEKEAQLRWFLVDPSARGRGLGTGLLREAVAFCGGSGYGTAFLWTVSALTPAARRPNSTPLASSAPARSSANTPVPPSPSCATAWASPPTWLRSRGSCAATALPARRRPGMPRNATRPTSRPDATSSSRPSPR